MKHPKSSKQPLLKSEEKRLLKLIVLEEQARIKGFSQIAGVDEAGRGPLAGPVVAAACLFRHFKLFEGINDSKLLTPARRKALFEELTSDPSIQFGIGVVDHAVIDEINILQASLRAMREAVKALPQPPDYLLIDGNIPLKMDSVTEETVVKGDQRSQLIAAASILAKETRDRMMVDYHFKYPHYGFDQHKGYATEKHREAIKKYGLSPIHRRSFSFHMAL